MKTLTNASLYLCTSKYDIWLSSFSSKILVIIADYKFSSKAETKKKHYLLRLNSSKLKTRKTKNRNFFAPAQLCCPFSRGKITCSGKAKYRFQAEKFMRKKKTIEFTQEKYDASNGNVDLSFGWQLKVKTTILMGIPFKNKFLKFWQKKIVCLYAQHKNRKQQWSEHNQWSEIEHVHGAKR